VEFSTNKAVAEQFRKQHIKPIRLFNPDDKSQHIDLEPKAPFMGSGTTATTFWGTMANYIATIAEAGEFIRSNLNLDDFCRDLDRIGYAYGISYESVWCEHFEELQFLKQSPYMVNGEIYFYRNLGTFFRKFGSYTGHLEPKHFGNKWSYKEFNELMADNSYRTALIFDYMSAVVEGSKNEPGNIIMNALRETFIFRKNATLLDIEDHLKNHHAEGSWPDVPIESLLKRYGCDVHDLELLSDQIRKTVVGSVNYSRAMMKFLVVDYGYPDLDEPEYTAYGDYDYQQIRYDVVPGKSDKLKEKLEDNPWKPGTVVASKNTLASIVIGLEKRRNKAREWNNSNLRPFKLGTLSTILSAKVLPERKQRAAVKPNVGYNHTDYTTLGD